MKQEMKKIIEAVGVIHVELAKIAAELDNGSAKPSSAAETAVEDSGERVAIDYTESQLREEVGYNELKKIAAEVGVSAKGKRDDIVERILEKADVAADEEEKPEKNGKVADFEEKKAEKESKEQEVGDFADSLLDENDEKDIIDILKQVGVKSVTKKNLRSKLISALADGLLDEYLDDEEDEEDSSDGKEEPVEEAEAPADDSGDDDGEDSSEDDGEEVDGETYFEDYDTQGVNNPNGIDEARLSVMVETQQKILDSIEAGKLKTKTMKKFLMDNSTEDEQSDIDSYDEDDIIAAYCELRKAMIDDDGDSYHNDPGNAYYINDELFQCGHKCVELDGELVSEVTGDKWEV